MKRQEFLESMGKIYDECLQIASKKNQDYAGDDDAFKNFKNSEAIGISVEQGILVRIMDKITRISNLLTRPAAVIDEKIEDTILDVINYFAILYIYLKNK